MFSKPVFPNLLKYMCVYMCVGGYMYSTVRLKDVTKSRLENFKEHKRESFDEVLTKLMDNAPKVKDELVSELIRDAKEHEKKSVRRFSSISEFRKEIEGH
jgi:hypothetical protein